MTDSAYRIGAPVGLACFLFIAWLAFLHPQYMGSYTDLGALIFAEILVAALWHYEQRFFPLLMMVFMWAGTAVPLRGSAAYGRWLVLAVAAIAGCVIYLRTRGLSLGIFHLVALFSVASALVSGMVSSDPRSALLKTASLLLLFLYGATGARFAVIGREAKFLSGMLLSCEFLVYISAALYFIFHYPIYGNPNSLGVVMGIVATPILLWGVLVSEGSPIGRRRFFAFGLCQLLLLSSYARAGFVAAAVSYIFLCVGLRRYRLLMKCTGMVILAAALIATIMPRPGADAGSFVVTFLYKGHRGKGIMASRRSPWDQTAAVIRKHPWFGSGFGTSVTSSDEVQSTSTVQSEIAITREHGNSYLAITEWVGLLGVVPFLVLVCLVGVNVGRVMIWVRRTGNPYSPALPIAAVLAAGVVHATFEDWMFAVGYYMCVFFWILAFVLVDLTHNGRQEFAHPASTAPPCLLHSKYGVPAVSA
jgi:O-antigen ligase